MTENVKILTGKFEVFGMVQTVAFRMQLQGKAKEMGVRGWCLFTENDTVLGEMEAVAPTFTKWQNWLRETGSPDWIIDHVIFSKSHEIDEYAYESFKFIPERDPN